jgi:uncharacterized protein
MMKTMNAFGTSLGTTVYLLFSAFAIAPQAFAADYENALKNVEQVKAVFDVSSESAKFANAVFWAVENVYQDETVNSLPDPPEAAVVFHGPVVKLLSNDSANHEGQDPTDVAKFQEQLAKMRNDGVTLEVCGYALKVLAVDPETMIPAVTVVPNGFVSIVGYQAQGYEVVRIP